jgi:hypothetical protein
MKNGVYTAHITEKGVREIFVDQDVLELEHLNKLIRQNRIARESEIRRRKAKKEQEAYRNMLMVQKAVVVAGMILSFLLGYQLG